MPLFCIIRRPVARKTRGKTWGQTDLSTLRMGIPVRGQRAGTLSKILRGRGELHRVAHAPELPQ